MLNRKQNKTFNKLTSDSKSFLSGSEGSNVAVFTSEGDLETALIDNGFTQTISKDKFNCYYGHTMWWNEDSKLLVLNNPNKPTWTLSTEENPVLITEFEAI